MKTRLPAAPRLARWLLRMLLPREYREAVLGDLDEAFQRRCGEGGIVAFARTWYWRQVIHVDVLRLRGEARAERVRKGGGGAMSDVFYVELRQALRVFRRNPGFVTAVLVTLTVGIGGTTSIFSVINGLLLRPIPGIAAPSRLAAVRASEFGGAFGVSSYMDYLDFAERTRAFAHMAAFKPRQVDASAGGTAESLGATMVTSSYFDVLGESTRWRRCEVKAEIRCAGGPAVMLWAILALVGPNEASAQSDLVRGLGSIDAVERAHAAHSLRRVVPTRAAIDALVAILGDRTPVSLPEETTTDPGIEAARTLGAYREAPVDALIMALESGGIEIRADASFALGLTRSPRAFPYVLGSLSDADARVRERAARGLGFLAVSESREALMRALRDSDPSVRKAAEWALRMLAN